MWLDGTLSSGPDSILPILLHNKCNFVHQLLPNCNGLFAYPNLYKLSFLVFILNSNGPCVNVFN